MTGMRWDARHVGGGGIFIGLLVLITGGVTAGLVIGVIGGVVLLIGISLNKEREDKARKNDSEDNDTEDGQ